MRPPLFTFPNIIKACLLLACLAPLAVLASVRNPDAGDASDMMTADDHNGRPIEIGFNARYLLDNMGALTGPVTIKMLDHGAPAIFTGTDPRTLIVLMPMRV